MLSQEEKNNIRERAIFESEIRKCLEEFGKEPGSKKSWINSNIAILIIASIISGILVPLFQFSHKSIEWRRQNQLESYKFNIDKKEQFLKEFIILSALLSEIYEVSKNNDPPIFSEKEFVNKINEVQKTRFHQISKINYLLIFINNTKIRELFTDHTEKSLVMVNSLKELTLSTYRNNRSSKNNVEESWQKINKQIVNINFLYKDITDMVYLEIKRVKGENKNLHIL